MSIKLTLFSYWKDEEKRLGRELTVTEVATATGIHRNTLRSYLKGKTERPDLEVVDKLCIFFNVPNGTIPFLVFERD